MESETIRVLMVDDSDTDFILFSKMLRAVPNRKFQVDWVSKFDQAIETIQKNTHDIYFFDYRLGPRSGLELMREAFRPESMPPVILLTGFGDYEVDVEAMRLGASDFLNKNSLDSSTLERAIRYAFDRKESRDTLQKKNLLLSSILENMGEGVAMTDMSGNLIFFNQNAERILGSGPNLGTSESWSQEYGIYLLDRQTPYPAEELPLARALKGEVVTDTELFIRNKNVPLGIYLNVRSRPLRNDEGVIVGAVTVFRDVTAIKAAEEQLIRHALYCSVTHLPNRQLFSDRVEQSIRRLKKDTAEPFTVFIMSLGGFQKITDTFGKDAGDRILKGAGRRLEDLVANGDTVAHLESNEFGILLNKSDKNRDPLRFAEKVQHSFQKSFFVDRNEIFATATLGAVQNPVNYTKAEDIIQDSHTALYWARNNNNSPCEFFSPSMRIGTVENILLETNLRHALERGEFLVHYQPVVSLESGKLKGFEALLRWNHPIRGMVSPAEFVPLAEETGLILPIGEWVLQEACLQSRLWQDKYPDHPLFSISVNLSAKQFAQKNLVDHILQLIAAHDLKPHHINLEITESVVTENFDAAFLILNQLKREHIQLHMDDFGTGFSSLSQLHRFPLDTLKIDKSFINLMTVGDRRSGIVRTIITLAHELGMGVIAEGVESAEQFWELKALKCKEGQGYFFSKPLPPAEAELLLAADSNWGMAKLTAI